MAGKTRLLLLFLLLAVATTIISSSSSSSAGQVEMGGWSTEEEEFGLDSEWSRRILATTNYISYDALKKDSVPCSQRGASYYNCQPGASANPYSRGCSAITQCRS